MFSDNHLNTDSIDVVQDVAVTISTQSNTVGRVHVQAVRQISAVVLAAFR